MTNQTKVRPITHWTAADIPDQTGRTAIVTGANSGLGFETAAALAAKGARVVLAVRNLDKGKVAAESKVRRNPSADLALQQLDLASLASIASGAGQLVGRHDSIDLLINPSLLHPRCHQRGLLHLAQLRVQLRDHQSRHELQERLRD